MSTTAIIQNLEQEVILKVENRTSETANADRWIRDALIELSGNPDLRDSFSELEILGPQFNLTGGDITTSIAEYAESNFVPAGPPADYNIKTLDFLIWVDYPTNQQRRQLNPSHFQATDRYQSNPSLPVEWYRFGNSIGFEPTPNQNYQVQARLMRRHPIIDYWNANGLLNTTPILMPAEWYEIIEWTAAMRGFMELLEFEKATSIRTLLWGDPDKPTDFPGLIASVKTKRRGEAWLKEQPLRVRKQGYTWGSS